MPGANLARTNYQLRAGQLQTVLWSLTNPFGVSYQSIRSSAPATAAMTYTAFFAVPPFTWGETSFAWIPQNNRWAIVMPIGFWWGPFIQVDVKCSRACNVSVGPFDPNADALAPVVR